MKIGLIAGHGDLIKIFIAKCTKQKIPLYVLAYLGHTNKEDICNTAHSWLYLGQIGKTLQIMAQQKITHVVLAGYFNRPSWSDLRPDLQGMKLVAQIAGKPFGDDGMFKKIVQFIETNGFKVIAPEKIIGDSLFMPKGTYTKTKPDEQAIADIQRGLFIAKEIGKLDIGQSVVVQQGIVLGVEAIDGSDCLIERCSQLQKKGSGGVFAKVIKPNQETRIDRSVIGPKTVYNVAKAKLQGIAIEANNVMIIKQAEVIALADANNLFITSV